MGDGETDGARERLRVYNGNSENVDSIHGDSHGGLNDNADEFNADLTDGVLFNNGFSDGILDGSETDGGVRQPDVILCLLVTSNLVMFAS